MPIAEQCAAMAKTALQTDAPICGNQSVNSPRIAAAMAEKCGLLSKL